MDLYNNDNITAPANFIEKNIKTFDKNRPKVEELISKLGKFDGKFLTKEPTTAHSPEAAECLSYLVKPEVLIEKTGNKNKGVYKGTHIDYGDLNSQRTQYKEDKNVFNMWVRGEIQGSILVNASHMGPENALTGELFFGCLHPDQFRVNH